MQGFDGNLADHVFGVNFGRFEARSKSEEVEEVRMNIDGFPLALHILGVSIPICYQCHLSVLSRPALYDSDK